VTTRTLRFRDADAFQFDDNESWLAARGNWIGSSDSAYLYGAVPGSVETLIARKLGLEPELEKTDAMMTGHEVEKWLVSRLAESRSIAHTPRLIVVSRRWPWMSASPDGIEFNEDGEMTGLVEAKFTKRLIEFDPADAGWHSISWDRGERPLRWVSQAQHQMAVTGLERVISPTFIGGDGRIVLGIYERNEQFIARHVAKCRKVWDEIQALRAPELSAGGT
jgi:predicted phage-related endonuclease